MVFVARTFIIADTESSGVMMPSTSQSTEMFAMSLTSNHQPDKSIELFRHEETQTKGQISLTLLPRQDALPVSLLSFPFGEARLPCAVYHQYQ